MIVGAACKKESTCNYPGCKKTAVAKGACREHYGLLMPGGWFRDPQYKRTGKIKEHPEEYRIWLGMITRCYNPKRDNYKYYGGRGIEVCDEWRGPYGFETFLNDMGPRPVGKTLDRKNSDKGYSKENCRWVSACIQNINKKSIQTPYIHFDKSRQMFRVIFGRLKMPSRQFEALKDAEKYRNDMLKKYGREDILSVIKEKEVAC